MSIFKGKNIQIEIYGQSHSKEIGVKAKGFPKFVLDQNKLTQFLQRRKAKNGVYSTTRIEDDIPIFTKLKNGKIIKMVIK